MVTTLRTPTIHDFELNGSVSPLVGLRKAVGLGTWSPTRPLGGWLMVYALIKASGALVPIVDRDDQVMEAAKELGHIDWSQYLDGGVWNDTHDEKVRVGVPTGLEFHDETTVLAKAHGKTGFWTEGHLFDRTDPESWERHLPRDKWPTPNDLDRADHFWNLSQMLKGTPRPLGLSAHGLMAESPCGKRIIWCKVTQAAVCELPKNPGSTAEPLLKGSPLRIVQMRKGMVTRSDRPCGACDCPAGSCEGLLRKAVHSGNMSQMIPQDLEGVDPAGEENRLPSGVRFDRLVSAVMKRFSLSRDDALAWLEQLQAEQTEQQKLRRTA